jgi:Domain of unknown function (DUF1929)
MKSFKKISLSMIIFVSNISFFNCIKTKENEPSVDTQASVKPTSSNPAVVGQWGEPLVPPREFKNIQAIHSVLLPNGKILMVNGSSNRDAAGRKGVDTKQFVYTDNTAIFDPVNVSWQKIDSFPATVRANPAKKDIGIDVFCAGHLHLMDGRVLFAGGTMTYDGNFRGARLIWIFDSKTNSWTEVGPMQDGRWYPSLFPLTDGKIAIVSGLLHDSAGVNSSKMEVLDPKNNSMYTVNLANIAGSPFAGGKPVDHYPRIFQLFNGKYLWTGDGTGVGNRTSQSTYLMTINPSNLAVSFQAGPQRALPGRIYGTGLIDPNSPEGDVLLMGGQSGSNDGSFAPNFPVIGARVHSVMERYNVGSNSWSTTNNFLGSQERNVRIGHYALYLPTGEFIVINGANYTNHRGAYNPMLYTSNGAKSYVARELAPAKYPRFYHNTALLLPDGRIWVNGGNRLRAVVNPDGSVDQGLHEVPTDSEWLKELMPRELTTVEMFSPPYLFQPDGKKYPDSARPKIINAPATAKPGSTFNIQVEQSSINSKLTLIKLGSATHALDYGQRFAQAKINSQLAGKINISLPENPNQLPGGVYMMFYVNDKNLPSVAKMITIGVK